MSVKDKEIKMVLVGKPHGRVAAHHFDVLADPHPDPVGDQLVVEIGRQRFLDQADPRVVDALSLDVLVQRPLSLRLLSQQSLGLPDVTPFIRGLGRGHLALPIALPALKLEEP
ncbi:glycine betaine ABC transporter substrate-binding protein [Streptosporangium sp. NBC_01639]|nr:glycine betaine ABC transporter substrate-binding protein [Streptosporangium sp. NBC_01639]